ncbi:MAG: serine hydrolase [Actinomycetota bacterium]
MTNRAPSTLAVLAAAALCLTGCTTTDTSPDPAASSAVSTVEIPSSELGAATTWVLDIIRGDAEVDEAEIEERFAPETIAQIGTPAELVASFESLQTLAPYTVLAYEETGAVAGTRLEAGGEGVEGTVFLLSVSLDDDGLLTGASIQPAPEIPEPAADWDELTDRTDEIGAPVTVTVFDVSDGAVDEPIFSAGDLEGAQPSGSMFKLFVLLAVVDAVDEGTLAWDDTLTLTDATRSLPSGELQEEPDGTEVSVEEAALGMISISDNTATDLLIEAIGIEAVEAQITEHATDGADATTPMLSTRAFFQLGWGDEELRSEWAAADDDGRETVRERVDAGPLTTTATDVVVPIWQDGVDWFFSSADLARVSVALDDASDTAAGEPVAEILTTNPGLETADDWDSVGFKGGSSVGVIGGTWLLQDDDDAYVVVVQSATQSEDEYLAQRSTMYLGSNAAVLLAED